MTRTLLPPPRAVSSSHALLVVSHPLPAPVAAVHTKVDHSGRFCSPRSARKLVLLCKGSELLDRILARGRKYCEEDAKVVMVQIFSVVSFCHLGGVVHRDLKPEKFLFTSKDETSTSKVINFGLSDFVKPDERFNDIVGNAYYVAPEVLYRSYGTEIDMWSIGVIAYILLCGSRPFWAHTESGIFRAVLKAEPSFDEAPWPTLTAEAKDFVKMLLNKDYRKRMTAAQPLRRARSVVSNWEGRDQSPNREEPTTSDSASGVHRGQLYSSRGRNQAAETPTIVNDEDVLSVLMEQHELFLSST